MKRKTPLLTIVILFFVITVIIQLSVSTTKDISIVLDNETALDKYILFTPEYGKNTYLINYDKEIVHMWESEYIQGLGTYLLDNGDLLRSDSPGLNPAFMGGGVTGQVERFTWNGTIVWEFNYSTSKYCLHHDIEPLPNGNILMIAWENKTKQEAIAAGCNPKLVSIFNGLWLDYIIEVEPNGSHGGNIIWEWHAWDHLIQDYDPTKNNSGTITDHPELIDINGPEGFPDSSLITLPDLIHMNSIDYNEKFDQILVTATYYGEIWVIDHSTTTLEAAGHSGGNGGKGGDLLYRWGNPQAYQAGLPEDQKLYRPHDARWITSGCPGEGNILVFNNGDRKQYNIKYSSVDEIVSPVDEQGIYKYTPGFPYEPQDPIWIYTAQYPPDFFSSYLSGAQRLPSGNTLICNGVQGTFFEVTPEKETIWEYTNPYPNPITNDVFKIQCYFLSLFGPDLYCETNLTWNDVQPGYTINDSISIKNNGEPGSLLDWEIESWPEWGTWTFTPRQGDDLSTNAGPITLQVSVIAPLEEDQEFTGNIIIINKENKNDYCTINTHLKTTHTSTNHPPDPPVNPIPPNMAFDIGLNPVLMVNVSDPDYNRMNITFYDANNESIIGVDANVAPGEKASMLWPNLEYSTMYTWYVLVSDGVNTTQSTTWSFTTRDDPNKQITADFKWAPSSNIHINEVIYFFDTSTSPNESIISWHWDFGDGANDTIQHPTHSYGEMGEYDVKLSVVDSNTHGDTKTKKITIINSPPIAIAGPDQIVNTKTVTFNGTGSWDPDGTIAIYKWNFGDGINTTGAVVTHTYPTDSIYTVTLNVTDNSGVTNEDYCTIIVDTVAPKTNMISEGTKGENDWYISTVTTTFHSIDATSGINATYYMLNQGPWNIYTSPFNISNEDLSTLTFYSVDNAGNIEDMNMLTVKIDGTPPSGNLEKPREQTLYIFDREIIRFSFFTLIFGKITLEAQALDEISGIEKVEFFIDNEMQYSDAVQPYEWVYDDKAIFFHRHTIVLRIYDAAGNSKETDEFDFWVFNF